MNLSYFSDKYNIQKKNGKGFARKVNSTHKWVEYTIDVKEMRKLLSVSIDMGEKSKLNSCLSIAERKREYHYRQDNFSLRDANIILSSINF